MFSRLALSSTSGFRGRRRHGARGDVIAMLKCSIQFHKHRSLGGVQRPQPGGAPRRHPQSRVGGGGARGRSVERQITVEYDVIVVARGNVDAVR